MSDTGTEDLTPLAARLEKAERERGEARRERDDARKQIIVGWYGDEVPSYTQGPPTHELEELMTADQANHLVAKLVEARGALDKATAELEMWRECAEGLSAFVVPVPADMADHAGCAEALAEFERLKEASK